MMYFFFFFFSSRRRHTRSLCDWSSDVCSSDLKKNLQTRLDALTSGNDLTAKLDAARKALEEANRHAAEQAGLARSEERRVGKECRARWGAESDEEKKVREKQ